jgi:CubicO group peptidase (beta-lactamase class C family)
MSDLYDWSRSTGLLAAQAPWWQPGAASGYHAVTFGHLIGEVVRRITGRSLGRFFRDEVAAPLSADFHIGLAAEHESRLGEMVSPAEAPGEMTDLLKKVMSNPRGWSPGVSRDRAYRAAEVPGANGHGNARSVARVATALASGGSLDGVRLLPEQFFDAVLEEQIYGQDLVLGLPIRWGLGVGLPSKQMPLPNPRSFYWGGWGGSLCLIDLDARVACAYVMNKMSNTTMGDRRGLDVVAAVYGAL